MSDHSGIEPLRYVENPLQQTYCETVGEHALVDGRCIICGRRESPARPTLERVELHTTRDHKHSGGKKERCVLCGERKAHMGHWGAPPSLNVHGSGANHWAYQNLKTAWQERLGLLLSASPLPVGLGGVLVEGEMGFPDRIRRDQGNFRFMIEKALGDALVAGGWLEDDDWTRYEFGGLRHAYERGESWTHLVLFPRWPEDNDEETP